MSSVYPVPILLDDYEFEVGIRSLIVQPDEVGTRPLRACVEILKDNKLAACAAVPGHCEIRIVATSGLVVLASVQCSGLFGVATGGPGCELRRTVTVTVYLC